MVPYDGSNCGICARKLPQQAEGIGLHNSVWRVKCDRCGRYAITDKALKFALPILQPELTKRLSALTRERDIHGASPYFLFQDFPVKESLPGYTPIVVDELIRTRWPTDLFERLGRVLLNLAAVTAHFGQNLEFDPEDEPRFFATSRDEFHYFYQYLRDSGLVQPLSSRYVSITPLGWSRISELNKLLSTTDKRKVLVAMWFDKSLDELAIQIERAISEARDAPKFEPVRIDAVEFLGDVVDRVIGTIRESRFIVADFTGHRNGVYFEAGFAEGLGIPVIYTCRKQDMSSAHFDTNHFNHIVWETELELYERLKNRIRAVIT